VVATLGLLGGLVGLVAGSFLNVVAYRIPAGKSVVTPRSACPACGHEIRPRDNVPVLSWMLLRGRCRDCGAPISPRYPIVEAVTAVLWVLAAVVLGAVWVLPAYWWFVAVTVVLTLTDLDHKLIPNRILLPGTVVGVVLLAGGALLDGDGAALARGIAGGAAYFGGLFAFALAARGGFGFGDVKLSFLLGLFLAYRGWDVLAVGVFLAFVLGGLFSVGLLIARRMGRRDTIPFGPFLVLGSYLGIVFGSGLFDWYAGV
jgi:leader peptidase (prepilin peptidase) / N-methyltransferase